MKLVVNSILNPMTALLRCRNGEILNCGVRRTAARRLMNEIGNVVRGVMEEGPSDEELMRMVEVVVEKTAANKSSMLQDVLADRQTEIDYINGYIVRKGEVMGLDVRLNRLVAEWVNTKRVIEDSQLRELGDLFGGGGGGGGG